MRKLLLVLPVTLVLAFAAEAGARDVIVEDNDGRPITFDVRANGVDVEWYADLLRQAAHGDEISDLVIRIVPPRNIRQFCGAGAGGCYTTTRGGARMVVPASESLTTAHTLLHEYAHHLDRSLTHRGLREPNGTSAWWVARKMGQKLANGRVARSYSLGWDRSIGEIFAEDYSQLHLETIYKIGWLRPPGMNIRNALKRDLENSPDELLASPRSQPVVINRSGTLSAGQRRTLPFTFVGPNRRATFTATLSRVNEPGARARLELTCGARTFVKRLRAGERTATIDRRNLGPAECEIALVSTSARTLDYTVRLRLAA